MNRTALFYVLLVSLLAFTCAKPGLDREINSWYKATGVSLIPKTEKKEVPRALREAGDNWRQLAAALMELQLPAPHGLRDDRQGRGGKDQNRSATLRETLGSWSPLEQNEIKEVILEVTDQKTEEIVKMQ